MPSRFHWQICGYDGLACPKRSGAGFAIPPRTFRAGFVIPARHKTLRTGWHVPPGKAFAQPTSYRPWPGFRHPCRNDGLSILLGWFPRSCVTAIKLSRHTGRDCRYPEHREVNLVRPPWPLGSGIPCRNDGFFLNLMAVTLLRGNRYRFALRPIGAGAPKNPFPRRSVGTIKVIKPLSPMRFITAFSSLK